MTDERWDDERLAAAFADRFDRPAPRELATAVLDQVRETTPRPRWWPTLERPSTVRLVSGLAVVAVLAVLVLPRSSGPGPSAPSPSAPGASAVAGGPSGSPAPGVPGFSATAAGLAVRSVADAGRLVADPTTLDTELAVAGWYSARDLALPCPYQVPTSPVAFRCEDVAAWLSGTDQPLLSVDGSPPASTDTGGTLDLRFIDPVAPLPGGQGPRQAMITTPVPVIVVGHFHDERSARCTTDEMADCQRAFVVDTVAGRDGRIPDPSTTPAGCPLDARCGAPLWRLSNADVAARARSWVGSNGAILSLGRELGSDPPWFDQQTNLDCLCRATWFVRGYSFLPTGANDPRVAGTPVAGWLFVDDQTAAVSGSLYNDGGPTATPAPPSPPARFPASIEGLPVMSVSEAISRNAVDDRPVAIAGSLFQAPPRPCPTPDAGACQRDRLTLSDLERVTINDGAGASSMVVAPAGDLLHPAILTGSDMLPPPSADGRPLHVILVMHRGDPRADRDGPGRPVASQDYVLDQVAWVDGAGQPAAVYIEPGIKPTLTPETALRVAGPIQTGQTWTISMSAVRANDLATIGSTATTDAAGIVWLIRLTGKNPLDPTSGPNGWGTILVEEATGQFSTDWTNGP
jgi:hypothetical protein